MTLYRAKCQHFPQNLRTNFCCNKVQNNFLQLKGSAYFATSKCQCITSGLIEVFSALLYIWLLLIYGSFSLYPYIARHCSLPSVKVGKFSVSCHHITMGVRILSKTTTSSRPLIFVHPKNFKLDDPLKKKVFGQEKIQHDERSCFVVIKWNMIL